MTGTQKATLRPWLPLPFHSSPTHGGKTLGAFAHSLCGYGHLRTLDCECWGCREIVNALLPIVNAYDAMREALRACDEYVRRIEHDGELMKWYLGDATRKVRAALAAAEGKGK